MLCFGEIVFFQFYFTCNRCLKAASFTVLSAACCVDGIIVIRSAQPRNSENSLDHLSVPDSRKNLHSTNNGWSDFV